MKKNTLICKIKKILQLELQSEEVIDMLLEKMTTEDIEKFQQISSETPVFDSSSANKAENYFINLAKREIKRSFAAFLACSSSLILMGYGIQESSLLKFSFFLLMFMYLMPASVYFALKAKRYYVISPHLAQINIALAKRATVQ